MVVKIGIVNLNNVLRWEEDEVSGIPKKRVVGKTSPTVQAEFFTREPKIISLVMRMTKAEKQSLETLRNQFSWQQLYDYDDTFIDWVWIEKITPMWRGDIDEDYPWEVSMSLVCSST